MKVAVHQPNFLPWGGYFHKMLLADVFVFLDTVQFPRGKSYCNRVKIKNQPSGTRWLTVPVAGKGQMLPVKDITVAGDAWVKKHLGTLAAVYGKTRYFQDLFPRLRAVYTQPATYLAGFNITLIELVCDYLAVNTRMVRASQLDVQRSDTGDYIVDLVKFLGGTVYVTGQGEGTRRYLDREKFSRAGIGVEIAVYSDPVYEQPWGEFAPGLSVVDILFNTGAAARELILAGGTSGPLDD